MTAFTPTPEPARAEPVGGIGPALPDTIALLDGYRFHRVEWCASPRYDMLAPDGFTRVGGPWTPVDAMNFAAALAPASDAGLAEVERLVGATHPGMYVVLKRNLFYRPKDCGYTGILDHAGIYTEAEARKREDAVSGVSILRWEDAPEFTSACFDDLARSHLQNQRDQARAVARGLSATIAALRTERDRLRADAAGRGEGVFGPERHMDEIDAAREAFGWLEALALKLPRIANEQITIEREDVGVRVYWRENKPHAVMLTIRDGLNFTFGMGFNLARIAAAPAPATDGTGGRSDG